MTGTRPLQSVEVLTTPGSRDPPYNRPAGGHLCPAPRAPVDLVPGCSKCWHWGASAVVRSLGVNRIGKGDK